MRLITRLRHVMDNEALRELRVNNQEPIYSVFSKLFSTTTVRVVTTQKFLNFAGEFYDQSAPTPEEANPILQRVAAASWWLEVEGEDDAGKSQTIAIWSRSVSERQANMFFVTIREEDGALVVHPLTTDTPMKHVNVISHQSAKMMLDFLYALENMPERSVEEKQERLGVPKFLRDSLPNQVFFSSLYLRGHQQTAEGEHSVMDISGRRWHFVRAHWMTPHGKDEKVRRRAHWRGDPTLGVVRKIYVGKSTLAPEAST